MKYNNTKAELTTVTFDKISVEEPTDNIYKAISIIAKRAKQIDADIKKELNEKLDEFAIHSESLTEIFENREQIQVSKIYEKLPKPHAIALQEWLDDKIRYHEE